MSISHLSHLSLRELFEEEWCQIGEQEQRLPCCPVSWLLEDLLRLVGESHDRPIITRAALIRRIICEQGFVEDAGDPIVQSLHDDAVEEYVAILTHVLERVRLRAMEQGDWSAYGNPMEYYG